MSEISLPALVAAGGNVPAKSRLPMQEINSAYKTCKFGLFHVKLLSIAFTGFIAGVLVSNTTSYLLPSAECDLKMSLVQKGILNAIPYLGMLLSSVLAGFLTDAFGRKIFVVVGYGGIFVFTLIAGTSQTFATSFSAVLTLTSEFCYNEIRDRVMLCQSSFAAFAQILVPPMSWTLHELPEDELKSSFRHQIVTGLHNIKPMFHKPLVGYLALICFMNFLIMALYNVIRLWFPQLSTVVEHYKVDDSQDLCEMLDTYTHDLRIKARNYNVTDVCVPTKSGAETYINSIILGCVCLLPYCVTGILVNRVGKKPLTLAISLMMMCGRVGTLVGNITFPILLDMAC
ncbi:putative synaptic vesicle protein, partial [Operophtera brumata]